MSGKASDPKGLPYAGGGPTVNDDGTPMANREQRVVGGGSDTSGPSAGYVGTINNGTEPAPAVLGNGRSAGENSGTGFAQT